MHLNNQLIFSVNWVRFFQHYCRLRCFNSKYIITMKHLFKKFAEWFSEGASISFGAKGHHLH